MATIAAIKADKIEFALNEVWTERMGKKVKFIFCTALFGQMQKNHKTKSSHQLHWCESASCSIARPQPQL